MFGDGHVTKAVAFIVQGCGSVVAGAVILEWHDMLVVKHLFLIVLLLRLRLLVLDALLVLDLLLLLLLLLLLCLLFLAVLVLDLLCIWSLIREIRDNVDIPYVIACLQAHC
jgi:hypothetical protein